MGLPYKIVMKKLRRSTPSLTETLDPDVLNTLMDKLFPRGQIHDPEAEWLDADVCWQEEDMVLYPEVKKAIWKKDGGNPALGLDGFSLSVWKKIPKVMVEHLAECYNMFLARGVFPKEWKKAKLILIPKGTQSVSPELPKVRPICLLYEAGKILERVIAMRIKLWLNDNIHAQLSDYQFGFREGVSTVDALMEMKSIIFEMTNNDGVAIVTSLDVANAFNTLPWPSIRRTLKQKRYPDYIRRVIDNYLFERFVEYPVDGGRYKCKAVSSGVPQGSVLGPLLWNITFDYVLRTHKEEGCHILCFADDTLIIFTAYDMASAVSKANLQIGMVFERMRELGLTMSPEKTEVVAFHRRRGPDTDPEVVVE